MTSLRSFARSALLFCALLFACMSVAPSVAMAKVFKVEGQDGAAGDPGDGLDSIGGGGGTIPIAEALNTSEPVPDPQGISIIIYFAPSWVQICSTSIFVFELSEFQFHWVNNGGLR